MISYLIVGSGYRAEYFGRVAKTYPELFRAEFLCRSQAKADLMKAHTGIDATADVREGIRFCPDFIVVAVDRGHVAEVTEKWAGKGYPVLAETPIGVSEAQFSSLLKLQDARIACCEQYHRYPILAKGIRAIEEGLIGCTSSMYISLLHDYHAASLIRKSMSISAEESYSVQNVGFEEPTVETDSRTGAILDGRIAHGNRTMAIVSFESGKQVIYDFSPVQYRSYIRSRHLVVRGSRGEWSDTVVLYTDDDNIPQKRFLLPNIPEKYRCLDTQALRDRRRNWQDELAPDTVQDEFAISTLLLDMGEYAAGGPSPYPLREAIWDARFWLNIGNVMEGR